MIVMNNWVLIILNVYIVNCFPSILFTSLTDKHNYKLNDFAQNESSVQSRNALQMQIHQSQQLNKITSVIRENKFLNLFNVIKFENINCNVDEETNDLNGTCYHNFECENLGGTAMGTCANGLGVCCVFIYGCEAATNESISFFESPHYPMSTFDRITCTFSINIRKNVQQILLNFLTLELQRPTTGNCIQDKFVVTGQSRNFLIPVICGINTGQHMYIDVNNAAEDKILLSIFAKDYGPRAFRIRVTQLETNLAPVGCLQYYSGQNGIIKSFNYDDNGMHIEPGPASYFNNLNYAICIQRATNMCKISYANENKEENFRFELVNNNEDPVFFTSCESIPEIINCEEDFISINSIRMCGGNLRANRRFSESQSVITDLSSGPIVLHFTTDNENVGIGFKLLYFQESC